MTDHLDNRARAIPAHLMQAAFEHADPPELIATCIGHCSHADAEDLHELRHPAHLSILHCISGSGQVYFGNRDYKIAGGNVLVIAAGQFVQFRPGLAEPWNLQWLCLTGSEVDLIQRLLSEKGNRAVFKIGENPEINALFHEISDLIGEFRSSDVLLLTLATKRFVWRLVALSRRPVAPVTEPRIAAAIAVMQRGLTGSVAVDGLAKMSNLSRSHFAQLFKQQIGYGVLEYFIRMKLQRAAELIQTSQEQIKQIARSVGFRDPLYFSRQFRRVYGLPPTSFRTLMRSQPTEIPAGSGTVRTR